MSNTVEVIQQSTSQSISVQQTEEQATPKVIEVHQEGVPGVDGHSAYQLAVENGFAGTEQDWLDSLKGDPGKDGLNTPYRHVQGAPASVWHIIHNTGFHLNWRVVDSAGNTVEGRVFDVDVNHTDISFFAAGAPVAFSGEAYGS